MPDKPPNAVQPSTRVPSRRAAAAGAGAVASALVLMLLPLLWGGSSINRYIVAVAFLALCWGCSCLIMAMLDHRRGQ